MILVYFHVFLELHHQTGTVYSLLSPFTVLTIEPHNQTALSLQQQLSSMISKGTIDNNGFVDTTDGKEEEESEDENEEEDEEESDESSSESTSDNDDTQSPVTPNPSTSLQPTYPTKPLPKPPSEAAIKKLEQVLLHDVQRMYAILDAQPTQPNTPPEKKS